MSWVAAASRELGTDLEHLIVLRRREEAIPVFRPSCEKVQPMPDVGEHAVNVEDDKRGSHDRQSSACHRSES